MKVAAGICAASLCVVANANDNLIEIYKNTAFIHQNLTDQKSEFSLELPDYVLAEDIDVAASCELISLNLNEPKPKQDDEYAKITRIKDEISALNNKLAALNAKDKFLNNFPAFKEQTIANLSADADKFYAVALENLNQISQTKKQIDELNKKMQSLSVKNLQRLDLKFGCDPKFVKVSYPVNLALNLNNKISADVAKSKIEISQNLSIQNPLNSDLNNLTIALYPFYYSSNLAPAPFYPWYEGKPQKPMPLAAAPMMEASMEMADMRRKATSKKAFAKDIEANNAQNALSNAWQILNASLKAGETKDFAYDKQSLDAKFDLAIDGYGSASAFVRAKFKPERSVENTQTRFTIEGVNIGKRYAGFAAGEEAEEFFGKNELIIVKKENNGEFTSESFFGSKSKISRGYKYSVKNASKLAWDVVLEEQSPVSAHESVSVSLKNSPKESEINKDGKVSWKFTLKPNESKEINFAYEMTKPSE